MSDRGARQLDADAVRDLDDAALLFRRLGYTTAEQGLEVLTSAYQASRLLPRHRYIVQDVAERAASAP